MKDRIYLVVLSAIGKVLPALQAKWGYRAWFRPDKVPVRQTEREILRMATKSYVKVLDCKIPVYSWGEGRVVILVHGWSSRGSHMAGLVEPLVSKGFKVVTFDSIAHGQAEGITTDVFEMTEVLREVSSQYNNIYAYIAHSVGATCAFLALSKGASVSRLVFISPVPNLEAQVDQFARYCRFNNQAREIFKGYFEREYGHELWKRLNMTNAIKVQAIPSLLVHDIDDKESPYTECEIFSRTWQPTHFISTASLGHRRILYDFQVISKVTEFLM